MYTPAGGSTTWLTFNYPPVDFTPYFDARVHDNLSTDGSVRERVTENALGDILISFQTPNLILTVDLQAWAQFMAFALAGGQFTFSPNMNLADSYNCVLEDKGWKPKRNAPAKYAATVTIRILQDADAPSDVSQVLRRFYGIAT